MAELIYVIIVNYNGADDTNECVNSLCESDYKNLRIVIVDNASTTGRVSYNRIISEEKCTILYQEENIGFAGANNVGIKYAMQFNPSYILILNNDTVVTKGFLKPMVDALKQDESIGIATGKIYYFDDKKTIWFGGSYYDHGLCENKIDGIRKPDDERYNIAKDIPFATGCLWLIPTKVIETVGLMSEEYFLYYEDADYCERVKRKGYRIRYEPASVIYHKESRSTKKGSATYQYYNLRNYLVYISKYCEKEKRKKMYYKRFYRTIKDTIRGRIDYGVSVQAWKDFLFSHTGRRGCKK